MDADDGVGVVDWAGEHARQLRLAHALLELGSLELDVPQGALVVFGGGELEVLERLIDVLAECFGERQLFTGQSAAPEEALRLFLVVPETGLARELVELVYFASECREVKETPLAHRRAA